jgi:hypothetical protein
VIDFKLLLWLYNINYNSLLFPLAYVALHALEFCFPLVLQRTQMLTYTT